MTLDGHEERVVLKPVLVLPRKGLHVSVIAVPAALTGKTKKVQTVLVQKAVVHTSRAIAPVKCPYFLCGEEPISHEKVQVDQIRVARECRGTLIWGVA
jgi:hypothetical protein